jgi:hypothetical protein
MDIGFVQQEGSFGLRGAGRIASGLGPTGAESMLCRDPSPVFAPPSHAIHKPIFNPLTGSGVSI